MTPQESSEFIERAMDLSLKWLEHDHKMLSDLVERVEVMPENDQGRVWDLIDTWADSEAEENAKAALAERIRRFAFTRTAEKRALSETTRDRAGLAYANLQPRNPVARHAWLFADHWIELSADDIEEGGSYRAKQTERIRELREMAMQQIWVERGFEGAMTLLSEGGVADVVGHSLAPSITGVNARADFLLQCLSVTSDLKSVADSCIEGFLRFIDNEAHAAILSSVTEGADDDRIARLFRCAPFGQGTWRLLDRYDEGMRDRYWLEVFPPCKHYGETELIELVDHLLEAQRPRAAFYAAQLDWSRIETSRLKRLLIAVATVDNESADHYRPEAYQVTQALESLDGRNGISQNEMAQLEFLYAKVLEHTEHGIPNLEREIAESPASFVQALALASRRHDHGEDPPELQVEDPDRRADLASVALSILRSNPSPAGYRDRRQAVDTEALFLLGYRGTAPLRRTRSRRYR